jgi:hypothetical protein
MEEGVKGETYDIHEPFSCKNPLVGKVGDVQEDVDSKNPLVGKVGDVQEDVDSREQSEGRFPTAFNRRIFPCSLHMTTLDPGSAGFHWASSIISYPNNARPLPTATFQHC